MTELLYEPSSPEDAVTSTDENRYDVNTYTSWLTSGVL